MTSAPESITEQLLHQRIRNRIIEYWEWVSSYEAQRDYQARAPVGVFIPSEAINQWEDHVQPDWREYLGAPVFSKAECGALAFYEGAWKYVSDAMPDDPLEELIGTKVWEQLREAAERARQVFAERGKMPEDKEIDFRLSRL